MHGGVAGQAFQAFGHVDKVFDFIVPLVGLTQLRALFERFIQGHAQIPRDHFGDGVAAGVGHVQHPAYVPYHAFGSQGTERDDLDYLVLAVFFYYIVNNFLPPFETEVDVNIRHGHPLRVEEPLKKQVIPDRVDIRNLQAVGHDAACGRPPPRPYHNAVGFGEMDEIPDNKEIIHISHIPNDIQLINKPFPQFPLIFWIAPFHPIITKFIQITPGIISLRHIIPGKFGNTKLNLHIASLSNLMCIFDCLLRIGK